MSQDIVGAARRRTLTVIGTSAAALVALAAIVAGVVIALGHRDVPVAQPDPAPGAVLPGGTAPVLPPAGVSPVPSSGTPAGTPTGTPAGDGVRWVDVAGARVPVSVVAGPRDTHGGRARGFAHTPMGAVLAAVNISVRLSPQVGPDVFGPTLREQVVGPDADALGRHLDEDYQAARAQLGLPYGMPAGRLYSTTVGYRVDLLGADAATVRLLIEGPGQGGGSVLVALVTHMRWTGADWVLQAPNRGDWRTDAAVVTDASGYTAFPNRPTDGG